MALRKGDGMIEFYALLPKMRKMYEENGIVVAKRMYELLKNDGKISMGYKNFSVLFKRELSKKTEPIFAPKKENFEPEKLTLKRVEDLPKAEILQLILDGKIDDDVVQKLIDDEIIEDWDLSREHDLWNPPRMREKPKNTYQHNAGAPEEAKLPQIKY
jgi:hypothetical protein